MTPACRHRPHHARAGFTLIELLTVIIVIGILIGIVITNIGGVTNSAKRAKTKIQFSQWTTALESFRQEYGYYPNFTFTTANLIATTADTETFVQTLTGRKLDGTSIATGGNTKRIAFGSFGSDDLTKAASPKLQDAFGNTEIAVLFDKNDDGLIKIGASDGDYDFASVPNLTVVGKPPINGQIIRASIIFYSAGAGQTTADIVKSWE